MPGFAGPVIIQAWPIIYVMNKTDKLITDLYFTMDNYSKTDVKIKKVKVGATATTSIYNRGYLGTRNLYLYYTDKKGYRCQHTVYDSLQASYNGNILLTITDVNEDGILKFNVVIDYDPLKTH
ncbi:hypothetical protein [Clostridium manihotivorum]|uniref:Uncharacterized protein n=1 Tax=Clostridium manihotivorum TaxID=2320868 RepID=A0A410DV67_9CLOT|nr:hypothetical protein [Clostridium manihotivorum]QAA32955.1 hypothetical protein C1I91_15635 [Clostridium manihotivorum]